MAVDSARELQTPRTVAAYPGVARTIIILLPFGLGYFMSYLFRAVNAIVAPDLVAEAGLSAAELGLLTAAYLVAFALVQLPLGLLLDRFGPRRVQAAFLMAGALGAYAFSLSTSAVGLAFARALIGVGFAGGLMSGFKAVVLWVPEQRRSLANACVMSIGGLGLMVSTLPMESSIAAFGWRASIAGLAALTFAVALLNVFCASATAARKFCPLRNSAW